MGKVRLATALALVFLAASAGPAPAGQTIRAPRAGEEIVVRTDTGGEVRGRLIELSPESLAILAAGGRMDVRLDRVQRIDATRDSLANGAAIGAVGLGLWCAAICGQGLESGDRLPMAVAINAGLGALIGAGIDAAHKGRTPIYIKPAGTGGSALQVKIRF
jgi:hypothetical protein